MAAFFDRRPFTSVSAPSLIYWAAVAAVLLLGGSTVFGRWPMLVAVVAGSVALATRLSDALLPTRFWHGVRTRASAGPISMVSDRWRQMDERALERHVKRGRRQAIFEMGLRGIRAPTAAEQDFGRRALERALEMGLPEAGWWLGDHLEQRGEWAGAHRAYGEGRRLGDSYAAFRLGLLVEEHSANSADAIEVYEDAAFRMNDGSAAHSLGLMYRRAGKRRLMRRALRRGVQLGDTLSIRWLGDAYREAASDRRARSPNSAAILHAAARTCYQRALQRGDSEAARQLGELLLAANDVAGGIAAFEAGVRLRDATCARSLGEVLLKEGRDDEAERALHLAIEFSQAPDDKGKVRLTRDGVQSAWLLGQRVEARGVTEPAMRLYRFASGFSAEPAQLPGEALVGVAESAVRLARLLEERGERAEAMAMWQHGIALGSVEARVHTAKALLDRYDREDGLAQLRAAITALREDRAGPEAEPARLCVVVGDMFAAQAERDEAIAAYRLAVEVSYRSEDAAKADAGTRLVELIANDHRLDDARRLAGEEWRLRRPADRLALARFLIANDEGSLAAGLILDGTTADEMLAAGRLLEAAGETSRALSAYERAMDRGSLAAAERLTALARTSGDSALLTRAERAARLLGATSSAASSMT
jgi:tetratricopeptide (TPR) repeat protein